MCLCRPLPVAGRMHRMHAAIIWYNQPGQGHMEGAIDQDAFYSACPVAWYGKKKSGGEKWTVTEFFLNTNPYF
eukprot:SAG22_NODE_1842_length_3456_cov_3.666369_3_plen_73_part_00